MKCKKKNFSPVSATLVSEYSGYLMFYDGSLYNSLMTQ